jgi:cyclic di-GMP phosphodiesterase
MRAPRSLLRHAACRTRHQRAYRRAKAAAEASGVREHRARRLVHAGHGAHQDRSHAVRTGYTDELDSAQSVILTLGLTIESRDPSTQGHCERLTRYATAFGARLGLDDEQLLALHRGAFLHDVGKVGIPDVILLKPGRLTSEERAVMQQHPVIGHRLCGELRALEDVRPIVRHHHERPNGTGYPDGLEGDSIPLLARIMNVVDSSDALTTERPYKAALSRADAFRELREEAAKGWKFPALVEEFVAVADSLD